MPYTIDWFSLTILVIYSSLLGFIAISSAKSEIEKLYILFLSVTIVIYSGLGICYEQIGNIYLFKFLIFYTCTILSTALVFRVKSIPNNILIKGNFNISNIVSFPTLNVLVFSFFLVYIVRLIYPNFQLWKIFNPPTLDISNIFNRMDEQRSLPILELVRLINIFSFPFFMIYLQRKKNILKWKSVILFILLWIYLEFISLGYISRYELVLYFLFIFIIIINRNKTFYTINKTHMILLVIIFVILMPFFLSYESLRTGNSAASMNFVDSSMTLIFKETGYAKYYESASNMHQNGLWARYLFWMITLPIPNIFAGPIKKTQFLVNRDFSEYYRGVSYGTQGYSVILPSIFGEALILYGVKYYWIHGIFIGIFIGLVCKNIEKNPELRLLNLYFAIRVLAMGRGGTTGIIGMIINSMTVYIIIMVLMKIIYVKKSKTKRELGI